jgi:hypothetical protein
VDHELCRAIVGVALRVVLGFPQVISRRILPPGLNSP